MGKTLSDNAINQIKAMRVDVRQLKSQEVRSISASLPPLLPGSTKGSAAITTVQATVGSGSVAAGFSMTLYANGWNNAATGSLTGYPADMAIGDIIADGEQVMVFPTTTSVTGDSE